MMRKAFERLKRALKCIADYTDKQNPKNFAEARAMLDLISVIANEAMTEADDELKASSQPLA